MADLPKPDPSQGADVFHELDTGFSRYCFFFPLNGTSLLATHMAAITELAEELGEGKYFEIYAMADRTGSQQVNYQVSKGRYNAVETGLFQAGFSDDPENFGNTEKILGEDFWEFQSETTNDPMFDDDTATAMFRVVVVYVWQDAETSLTEHADLPLIIYGRSVTQPKV
jgi:hypothetical protein